MDKADRIQIMVRFGYHGARFYGLNPQPGLPTAGIALRARLEAAAMGQRAGGLNFTARTDRGVSATGNFATCWFREAIDLDHFFAALSAKQDDGLFGVVAWRVPWTTHARALGCGKHYRYRMMGGVDPTLAEAVADASRRLPEVPSPYPDETMQVWQIVPPLDVVAMSQAASVLVGTHDFSSFRGGPADKRPPVRTIRRLDVSQQGDQIIVDIEGDGFLRKMVRIVAGTLAEVGIGWRAPDDMVRLLAAQARRHAGPTAPARGLWLESVHLTPETQALIDPDSPYLP